MSNPRFVVALLLSLTVFGIGTIIVNLPVSHKFPIVNNSPLPAVAGIEGQVAEVTDVIDGDTIKVLINHKQYTVRYVGMNTPETVDPRKPIECFGKEASNENKELLQGKEVVLQKDTSETDKFGRLLRFVFLPLDTRRFLFVNDYLVREGFAQIDTISPDVKFETQFQSAETQARLQKKGLWGKCL